MSPKTIYSKHKVTIPIFQQSNEVRKINCESCNLCYVGRTSRNFAWRKASHKSDFKLRLKVCDLLPHYTASKRKVDINLQLLLTSKKF